MTPLHFFDFDGCLYDTAYECAVVAWCVRQGIEHDFASVTVDRDFLGCFYAVKPYVRYAREYVVFSSDAYHTVSDEASLARAVAAAVTPTDLKTYEGRFYATREAIKAESFDGWLRLNPPYPFALDVLRAVADSAVILSSKDRKTIVETLAATGIAPLGVYDFTYATSKREAMERLGREGGFALDGAMFLDDNVDHVLDVRTTGVRVLLASWGYVSPAQLDRAVQAEIPIATAENLGSLLGLERAPERE